MSLQWPQVAIKESVANYRETPLTRLRKVLSSALVPIVTHSNSTQGVLNTHKDGQENMVK